MDILIFLQDYIIWHYGRAVRDFFAIAEDLLWFVYHFFSLPVLTRTLFSPFSRIHTTGFSVLAIEASLQNIALNFISRAVGFLLRSIVISAGIVSLMVMAPLLAATLILWLFLPLIILFLLIFSIGIFA